MCSETVLFMLIKVMSMVEKKILQQQQSRSTTSLFTFYHPIFIYGHWRRTKEWRVFKYVALNVSAWIVKVRFIIINIATSWFDLTLALKVVGQEMALSVGLISIKKFTIQPPYVCACVHQSELIRLVASVNGISCASFIDSDNVVKKHIPHRIGYEHRNRLIRTLSHLQ